jgi:hypothetical protein
VALDEFENKRQPCRSNRPQDFILTERDRRRLLAEWGFTIWDMASAIRANRKAKHARRRTVNIQRNYAKLETVVENLSRKVLGALFIKALPPLIKYGQAKPSTRKRGESASTLMTVDEDSTSIFSAQDKMFSADKGVKEHNTCLHDPLAATEAGNVVAASELDDEELCPSPANIKSRDTKPMLPSRTSDPECFAHSEKVVSLPHQLSKRTTDPECFIHSDNLVSSDKFSPRSVMTEVCPRSNLELSLPRPERAFRKHPSFEHEASSDKSPSVPARPLLPIEMTFGLFNKKVRMDKSRLRSRERSSSDDLCGISVCSSISDLSMSTAGETMSSANNICRWAA